MAIRLVLLGILMGLNACSKSSEPFVWPLPDGFPAPYVPEDNPITDAKIRLGRHLFYDANLSGNQTRACASCHIQAFAFAEPKAHSAGATGKPTRRNTLALVNVAYNGSLTWAHSGLTHIEQQILIPLFTESPPEMGSVGREAEILNRLNTPKYHALFKHAFGESEPSFDQIVKALASFTRSLISFNSPFDRYAYQGQDEALSESAIRGMNLFFSERLECFHCHGGINFTQSSKHETQQLDLRPFHNIGLSNVDGKGAFPISDQGLFEITLEPRDMGRFRAPTLRNVAKSAPYMHDGSLATLSDVIDFYADGGTEQGKHSPLKSPFIQGFVITEEEKQDLIAFLHSLTDESFLMNPKYAAPE